METNELTEFKKNNNKSNSIKALILVAGLIVFTLSSTYAFFTSTIIGEASATTANAANFEITSTLDSATAIYNPKLNLVDEANVASEAENVTFTVTNSSVSTNYGVAADYYIYLKDMKISDNLKSTYFHWELLVDNVSTASGDFATSTITAMTTDNSYYEMMLNTEAIRIPTSTTQTVIFRIWLQNDPDVNQIAITNGTFEGRLYLEAVPVSVNNQS